MTQHVGLESLVKVHTPRAYASARQRLLYCVVCSPVEHAGKLEGVTWPCPPLVEAGWPTQDALCPNVSYYRRPCTLPPHGWQQSCVFATVDPEEDLDYDLAEGSTLRDLLEAISAGGPLAVSAVARWIEYRHHRDYRDAQETIGGIVAQVREGAVIAAQTERELLLHYLDQRPPAAPSEPAAPAPPDELTLTRQALRGANIRLYSLGEGPFAPGVGQLPYPRAAEVLLPDPGQETRKVDGQ